MENYRILSVTEQDFEACVQTIRSAFKENAQKYGFTKENYPSGGAFIELDDLKKPSPEVCTCMPLGLATK